MELQPRQREALTPLRDRWIHADPPGTGKTPMGLTWLDEQDAKRVLIVAPARVLSHWHDLIPEWTTLKSVDGMGTPAKRAAARADTFIQPHGGALVVGYETMRQDANNLIQHKWDAVIFDEAHRLKGRKNLVHKAATKLARRIPLIDLASGSPILNDAEEAWSLLHLLDPKRYSSFWRWAHEYFNVATINFGGHEVTQCGEPKDGALEAIAADLGTSLVMRDEDYLLPDLPKLIEYDYHVDMLPEEKAAYESMLKHNWMRTAAGKNIIASNVVAQMTRLRQLTSDFGGLMDHDTPGSKVETAAEVINEIVDGGGEQVLVLTAFKHTAYRLWQMFPFTSATYTGDMSEAALTATKTSFEAGDVRTLIGTFGVIREGVDGLQKAAHHVVLLDHEWTPELNRQAIARLRRYGQQSPEVYVHHIVLRDSIDQTVALANERKQKVIDVIVGKPVNDVLHGNL